MPDTNVLSTRIENGIALVTIGSPARIFLDRDISDALHEALTALENDDAVRVVVITGGAPGYFARHYSVAELIRLGEKLQSMGWKLDENAPTKASSLAKALHAAERMAKPVIAAISGTAMGGAYELALACDIRIAQLGDFQIGLPEINIALLPGGGGTQRLARTVGTSAALMHILAGETLSPREAAAKGFVHEAVDSALERAMVIAGKIAAQTPLSVRHIKRLVRGALEMPLDRGLQLETNLFLDLCSRDDAIERMKAYENQGATDPARTLEIK